MSVRERETTSDNSLWHQLVEFSATAAVNPRLDTLAKIESDIGSRLAADSLALLAYSDYQLSLIMNQLTKNLISAQGINRGVTTSVNIGFQPPGDHLSFRTQIGIKQTLISARILVTGDYFNGRDPGKLVVENQNTRILKANRLTLAALQVKNFQAQITRSLTGLDTVISDTLPDQLHRHGYESNIFCLLLYLSGHTALVAISGEAEYLG